jgi:peptide/nickel transport system permease protein
MLDYLIRRIISAGVTLFIISLVVFAIINLPAGDVMDEYEYRLVAAGYTATAAKEAADAIRQLYGLDRPLPLQYTIWLTKFVQGDMGYSLVTFQPVRTLVADRFVRTVLLALMSLIFAWVGGVLIGIYTAVHHNTLGDYTLTIIGFLGLSVPDFLTALVLLVFAFYVLKVGVPTGLMSIEYAQASWSWAKVKHVANHLWIPIIVGGATGWAGLMRIMRGNLLDVLGSQYIEMARAKGLPERTVVMKHAVRVAINPLISILGMHFPDIISASVVASIVLAIPTIGPTLLTALRNQDIYVAASIQMLLGILLVVGNFVADLLLAWADPRIRLAE